MCHAPLFDASFFHQLWWIDQQIANEVQHRGCPHCAGTLHQANYPRKPRGMDRAVLGEHSGYRFSFCCANEGCRRRCTPPSVRFLGRKVYLCVIIIAIFARQQHQHTDAIDRLIERLDLWPQTRLRWRRWWRQHVPVTAWYRTERARFWPPLTKHLPEDLLARFATGSFTQRVLSCARLLLPLTSASCARYVMARSIRAEDVIDLVF